MASVGSMGERDDATEHRVQQLGAAELVERLAVGGEVEARQSRAHGRGARFGSRGKCLSASMVVVRPVWQCKPLTTYRSGSPATPAS